MLSYQHDYHAGNFADIHKHLVLRAVLAALQRRNKPFVALDLHAGAGVYDLGGERARKTGEAALGIERLRACACETALPEAVTGFLETVQQVAGTDGYPGSPALIRASLRENDRLVACEMHPEAHERLQRAFAGDARCHVHRRDAREAARGLFPPQPRRGFALLDPSYERPAEYREVAEIAETILERWNTGMVLVWYPVLAGRPDHALVERLCTRSIPWVRSELRLRDDPGAERGAHPGLAGSGMLVLRPPWQLEEELAATLPAVLGCLDPQGEGALYRAEGLEEGGGDPTLRRVANV
ncbi:23S rRNA (adenine(2030)-N(6))-methyltransferase RlmJ [Thioalkalivibrio sp. ALE19]|uniref:23S rRNA (adenine(2030)-N(6))-methyltransferase RlmJ n=1 Tax=Thioalkalivibrio sp. ALE19 TaxID=1266909 RepID=UPI000405981D|nr:23S rRNA (adenine(2030)-N(6))-methyltransferase RlmJ [Thioalkalivibrio sp. ALE19]